jgi:hypothetical protein
MSINLLRNSKVYFTTNVETADPNIGKIKTTDFEESNTFEIQVLDDLAFNQTTAVETIAVNETGTAPIRGQRTFNTALNPVDFNFTTYMRPYDDATKVSCEESVLWNAMFGVDPIGGTSPAWTNGLTGSNPAVCVLTNSNKHQLQRFGIIVVFDQNTFLLHDCSLNTATIDFGIDAIASIQWSGQARSIERIASPTDSSGEWTGSLSSATAGDPSYTAKITTAPFIANKLSTIQLVEKIGAHAGGPTHDGSPNTTAGLKSYKMPLTGGSITLTNNITYLTPAYMGAINQPITYFTGSRSITGSLTAYLRTGSGGNYYSADLFSDLINQVNTDSDPEFYLEVRIGGETANTTRVFLEMPGVVLTIPTINAESVITTTVNFTAQGNNANKFDILQDNEIKIKYFA